MSENRGRRKATHDGIELLTLGALCSGPIVSLVLMAVAPLLFGLGAAG